MAHLSIIKCDTHHQIKTMNPDMPSSINLIHRAKQKVRTIENLLHTFAPDITLDDNGESRLIEQKKLREIWNEKVRRVVNPKPPSYLWQRALYDFRNFMFDPVHGHLLSMEEWKERVEEADLPQSLLGEMNSSESQALLKYGTQ